MSSRSRSRVSTSVAASPARSTTAKSSKKRAASPAKSSKKKSSSATAASPKRVKRAASRSRSRSRSRTPAAKPASSKKKRVTRRQTASVAREASPKPASAKKGSRKSRAKSPAKRAKSPAKRASVANSPAKRAKSPAKRARSPARPSSAAAADVVLPSPAKKAKTSSRKSTKSPARSRTSSPAAPRTPSSAKKVAKTPSKVKSGARRSASAGRRSSSANVAEPADSTVAAGVDSIAEEEEVASPAPASAAKPVRRQSSTANIASAASEDTPPQSPVFSPEPSQGGFSFMPRRSSYPITPKAKGVSTVLQDVPVPTPIFVSPFPADRHQGARRSFGGSMPNDALEDFKTARQLLENEEEDTEGDAAELAATSAPAGFKNTFSASGSKPKKVLRPTQAQAAAELAKTTSGATPRQQDTPVVSRSRSRLIPAAGSASNLNINEETSTSTTTTTTSSRRVSDGRVIESSSTTTTTTTTDGACAKKSCCCVRSILFVLAFAAFLYAQYAALKVSAPKDGDVLGLKAGWTFVLNFINTAIATYVKPYVPEVVAAAIPTFTCNCASASCNCAFLTVPALYFLAGLLLKKVTKLSDREAYTLTIDELGVAVAARKRRAHHLFVAMHAFVSALSVWIFYLSSQNFTAAAAQAASIPTKPGAPAAVIPPVFSTSWYSLFLILTTFSWSFVESIVFATTFTTTHLALWVPVMVVSETAYWLQFPTSLYAYFPSVVAKIMQASVAFIPAAITSQAVILPFFTVQVAESLKGLAGVFYACIGRFILMLVPLVYLGGANYIFQTLQTVTTNSYWLESMIATIVFGAISSWEIIQHREQLLKCSGSSCTDSKCTLIKQD